MSDWPIDGRNRKAMIAYFKLKKIKRALITEAFGGAITVEVPKKNEWDASYCTMFILGQVPGVKIRVRYLPWWKYIFVRDVIWRSK